MSKLTSFTSKKTGVPENSLTTFGAMLLALLPAKTRLAILTANKVARAVENLPGDKVAK